MRAFCNKDYNGECRRCNTLSVAFRPVAHMTSETYIYIQIFTHRVLENKQSLLKLHSEDGVAVYFSYIMSYIMTNTTTIRIKYVLIIYYIYRPVAGQYLLRTIPIAC